MLDFRIKTFLSVCKYMNLTYAAEELHITQPAVSQQIRYLEKLYGVRLLVREGKKIKLTHQGGTDFCSAALLWGAAHKNRAALLLIAHLWPLLY